MRSIVLFGMAGVGKSTVGTLVAQRLGRGHVDTDAEVERRCGKSIGQIFDDEGEAAFRDAERDVIADLATHEDLVISVGGGALLATDNVVALRPHAAFVLLEAPDDVIAARAADGDRPLLRGDIAAHVASLSGERAARYERVADATIAATAPPDEVADAVVGWASGFRGILGAHERQRATR